MAVTPDAIDGEINNGGHAAIIEAAVREKADGILLFLNTNHPSYLKILSFMLVIID